MARYFFCQLVLKTWNPLTTVPTRVKKQKFDLELKEGRFLMRLVGMSVVGASITNVLQLSVPKLGAYLVIFLTVLLIYIALVLLLPVLERLRALAGVVLAWEVGILISVISVFFDSHHCDEF